MVGNMRMIHGGSYENAIIFSTQVFDTANKITLNGATVTRAELLSVLDVDVGHDKMGIPTGWLTDSPIDAYLSNYITPYHQLRERCLQCAVLLPTSLVQFILSPNKCAQERAQLLLCTEEAMARALLERMLQADVLVAPVGDSAGHWYLILIHVHVLYMYFHIFYCFTYPPFFNRETYVFQHGEGLPSTNK